jgi:2-methylisocitrate lyase-like PEP mutase family enzyme
MSRARTARLRELIHRRDKVLAVLHPPTAAHARIMEKAGCEALFVGTGGVVGAYTGLADVGTATMTECVMIAGWIADSVSIPVIVDGDTGHGGIMAVRRLVRESIRAGLAGIRLDDQPIEGKRKTQNAGIAVVPLDQAIARYRAAVDMRNELDANFVVMAQCYARDAAGGTLADTIARMRAYREAAGVDWVQFESPHSVDETIKAALPELKHRPSEYVTSRRYFQSIEIPEGVALTNLVADLVGDDVLMYASDYPHGESHFPESAALVTAWDMAPERKRKLLWENAVRFYARAGLG